MSGTKRAAAPGAVVGEAAVKVLRGCEVVADVAVGTLDVQR